ncbi:MAG: N-acetyltransferase family protein [Coriobacteriales bacterium]|nr:N-acetyltransferase family protein [Actinomycetes bacterium]
MHIRPATAADSAAIAAIYNDAITSSTATFDTEPKTPEDRAAWLTEHRERHPVLVAEKDGRVVGWGACSTWSDRCAYDATVELSVYVDPDEHRHGVGRTLSRELIGLAPALGIHSIIGRICTENTASLALAETLGFSLVGVMHEVGRKFGRWLDVAIWELLIDAE